MFMIRTQESTLHVQYSLGSYHMQSGAVFVATKRVAPDPSRTLAADFDFEQEDDRHPQDSLFHPRMRRKINILA
eukprot:6988347-Prymnesium_polylepis.1